MFLGNLSNGRSSVEDEVLRLRKANFFLTLEAILNFNVSENGIEIPMNLDSQKIVKVRQTIYCQ